MESVSEGIYRFEVSFMGKKKKGAGGKRFFGRKK